MKIVQISNYWNPELGYQEYFLSKAFIKLGHEVFVLTSDKHFPQPYFEETVKNIIGERDQKAGEYEFEGIRINRLLSRMKGEWVTYLEGLEDNLMQIKPDIVIHHQISGNKILNQVIKARRGINFRLICDNHLLLTLESNRKTLGLVRDFIMYKLKYYLSWNKFIEKYVGISDDSSLYINKRIFIPKGKIKTIPLGADTDRFYFDENMRIKVRESLGIKTDEVVIIYTGKIIESKDPIMIVESTIDLINKYQIKYLFVGNVASDYKEKFNKYVDIFADKIIHVRGVKNPELVKYYCAADLAVWPISASISTLEAMACKLPVIVSDYLKERVKNDNGYFIVDGNTTILHDRIEMLIKDRKLRETMGRNSLDLVKKEFNWENIAQLFIE